MKLDKAARAILSVTALAWSIPLAQAADTRPPGVAGSPALLVASGVEGVKDVKDGLQVLD